MNKIAEMIADGTRTLGRGLTAAVHGVLRPPREVRKLVVTFFERDDWLGEVAAIGLSTVSFLASFKGLLFLSRDYGAWAIVTSFLLVAVLQLALLRAVRRAKGAPGIRAKLTWAFRAGLVMLVSVALAYGYWFERLAAQDHGMEQLNRVSIRILDQATQLQRDLHEIDAQLRVAGAHMRRRSDHEAKEGSSCDGVSGAKEGPRFRWLRDQAGGMEVLAIRTEELSNEADGLVDRLASVAAGSTLDGFSSSRAVLTRARVELSALAGSPLLAQIRERMKTVESNARGASIEAEGIRFVCRDSGLVDVAGTILRMEPTAIEAGLGALYDPNDEAESFQAGLGRLMAFARQSVAAIPIPLTLNEGRNRHASAAETNDIEFHGRDYPPLVLALIVDCLMWFFATPYRGSWRGVHISPRDLDDLVDNPDYPGRKGLVALCSRRFTVRDGDRVFVSEPAVSDEEKGADQICSLLIAYGKAELVDSFVPARHLYKHTPHPMLKALADENRMVRLYKLESNLLPNLLRLAFADRNRREN